MIVRAVLILCGLAAASLGTWRGYANAREALGPVVEQGDSTRRAVDAGRPLLARSRVRRFVRGAVTSLVWLLIAMYGLFLVATASAVSQVVP